MDDRNFDKQTALDWINSVERPGKSWRDDHVYPKLSDLVRNSSAKTTLDLGCGQGICCEKIDLGPSRYIGIEPSAYLHERATQLYSSPNNEFLLGNAYSIPVSSRSVDCVFSILVWHLLMDLEKAAEELSRVLVMSGNFLIVTANPDAYSAWIALYPDAKLTGKKLEGTMQLGDAQSRDILHLHTFSDLKESFEKVGLDIEDVDSFFPSKSSPELKMLISIQGRKTR